MAQLLFNYGGVILALILELGLFYVLFLAKRPPRHRMVLSLAALLAVWVGLAAFYAFFDQPGPGKVLVCVALLAVCGGTILLALTQTYLPSQGDGKPTAEPISRRKFYAKTERLLLTRPKTLGHAALIMLDLDDMKAFNAHHGHDCGDAYIRAAEFSLAQAAPPNTLCAHMSGDEFSLLFYGYDSDESLRQALDDFVQAVAAASFQPDEGEAVGFSLSGGAALYPQDGADLHTLLTRAEFAMSQAKARHKGSLDFFDHAVYDREALLDQARQEFSTLIQEEKIFFHFQPIVNARTGEVFAYEALMRSDLPTLRNPQAILDIAREMDRLQDVEALTWLRAPHFFQKLLDSGKAAPDAYLFVNSIASQHMSPKTIERFRTEFEAIRPRIVIEITEAESINPESIRVKRDAPGLSGLLALDDYGSGYSNENSLLELAPHVVKVDMAIIRDIHKDPAKQRIVSNLVTYAHEREIKVVAEGIETPEELRTILELGVDLLQGYLLARPAVIPDPVPQEVVDLIREVQRAVKAET